jgi:hypothetical protein
MVSYFGHSSENEIYGNRKILCEYANVDSDSLVFGRIQHGWVSFNLERTLIKNDLVDTYVWSKKSKNFCTQMGLKRVDSIGSTWLYFLEITKRLGWSINQNNDSERKIDELWIYGAHATTTPEGDSDQELDNFLKAANNSLAKNKVVLLYYIDYFFVSKYVHFTYPELRIFTALGGRIHTSSAESHLYNLFWILNNSKKVILDVPTTALLYAITLNCDVAWHKNKNYNYAIDESIKRKDSNLTALLSVDGFIGQDVKTIVHEELGSESMRTPEQLRSLFKWGDRNSMIFTLLKILHYFLTIPLKLKTLKTKQ